MLRRDFGYGRACGPGPGHVYRSFIPVGVTALKKIRPELEACCLDAESGLYTQGHFQSVLSQELARLDRWERPLSLVILDLPDLDASAWAALGALLRDSLRRIDLAARLGHRRAVVILPDADGGRARRWLAGLLAALDRVACLAGRPLTYGRAVARPWEGRQADELLALALANLGREGLSAPAGDEVDDGQDTGTAIAADERNLLFDGFKNLGAN